MSVYGFMYFRSPGVVYAARKSRNDNNRAFYPNYFTRPTTVFSGFCSTDDDDVFVRSAARTCRTTILALTPEPQQVYPSSHGQHVRPRASHASIVIIIIVVVALSVRLYIKRATVRYTIKRRRLFRRITLTPLFVLCVCVGTRARFLLARRS